jgi:hypothetical protein
MPNEKIIQVSVARDEERGRFLLVALTERGTIWVADSNDEAEDFDWRKRSTADPICEGRMTALTKQQLTELTAEWIAWRKEIGVPVDATAPVAKGLTIPEVKVRDAAVIQAVMSAVAPVIYELEQKTAALSARVTDLEAQRNEMKYCGVWREGKEYTSGSFATHDGALWHANKKTEEKPGMSGDWTMAAKSGSNPRSDAATSGPRNGSAHGPPANPRLR